LTLAIPVQHGSDQLPQQDYTVVNMEDDGQHTRISYGNHESGTGQPGYDGDNDDTPFLGTSTRRFTVKRDGTMRYCQKCKYVASIVFCSGRKTISCRTNRRSNKAFFLCLLGLRNRTGHTIGNAA
jgi:hypothetical protein